ncbi:MAG: 4-hydroxy-tetrahydrodipicolinate synthase [Planctomycetota bacterium]|jgi:4-hydroxy-tetrahydrodipicolinate synthase
MDFNGTMVALVTPFRNGSVDRSALRALVEHVIAGGVAGVVPCGTTGESPTLSHDEHNEVVTFVVENVAGRVPVIAGTGSNSTTEAIGLTKAAERAGANACLSVNPYYNKPSQEGLQQHFQAVADASQLPVVLYNIPGRCGIELSLDTIRKLGEHPNIQAIKEATGNVENVTHIRRVTDLAVLSGDDSLTLAMLALGGQGVISVIGNLLPARMTKLVNSALEGNFAVAREVHDRLFPLMKAMFIESNPAPIKACLHRAGMIENQLRLPLCPVSEPNMPRLMAELEPFLADIRGS